MLVMMRTLVVQKLSTSTDNLIDDESSDESLDQITSAQLSTRESVAGYGWTLLGGTVSAIHENSTGVLILMCFFSLLDRNKQRIQWSSRQTA